MSRVSVTPETEEARKTLPRGPRRAPRIDVIRLAALTTEAIAARHAGVARRRPRRRRAGDRGRRRDRRPHHSIEDRMLPAPRHASSRSPTDLRFLVTVMRVDHELERSADLMVNVAKTTRRLYPHQLDPKLRGIIDRMGAQAANQTAGRDRRVRRLRPVVGARRSPTWTTRWTSSPRACSATSSPAAARRRGARAARRCRWRWSAGTTSGSPTTRSRSPSASASW